MARPRLPAAARIAAGLRARGPGALVLAPALALAGCLGAPSQPEASPAASREVRIEAVASAGPYRAADVRGVAGSLRFYFPPGGTCSALVVEGGAALYLPEGRFGSLAGSAAAEAPRCAPVGVASLAAWRDQLPVRRSRYLVPRERATLRRAGSAPGILLARGRLPLAVELRIPDPEDVVAIVPDSPACRSLLAARWGMLEFRPEGPDPLVLGEREDPCPILGLALPLALE